MAASMVQAVYTKLPTNITKFQSSQISSSFKPPTFTTPAPASISSLRRRFTSVGIHKRNSFVVRAESDAEATSDAAAAAADDDDDESATAVAVEDKPPPKKPIVKLGDIMGILNKQAIEATDTSRPIPDLRTGDIIEIKLEVPENRRRLSIYKGIIISRQNAGIHTTIRVRRIIAGVGVEIVFPIYSPNIKEIKLVKHRKVRRARLYYLRDKLPRLSTFK